MIDAQTALELQRVRRVAVARGVDVWEEADRCGLLLHG